MPRIKAVNAPERVSHSVRIGDPAYLEILQLSTFCGISISRMIDFMWIEFKKTKQYANLMLLGDKNKNKE